MFIKVVPNTKGKPGTFFCYLVESYRENGSIKHHTIKNFGLLEEDQVPFLKAMYAKKKPRLVYDDEVMQYRTKAVLKTALDDLTTILYSDQVSSAAKTTVRGFTQTRKISLQDVLLFYTFRHCETTNKDISSYFSKVGKNQASKQAMFKALNKMNPEVFPLIIREFAKQFYEHQDYDTLNGWIVLACDGSKMDLPLTTELRERFGGVLNQTIVDESKVKKPQASCSVLVDVINHVVLDACVKPYRTSELPMLYEHLENCRDLLQGKKVMILCDRYYGSAELFFYCKLKGYRLLVRAKSYMYKDQVREIESDGDIHLVINKAWMRRLKREDCRSYAEKNPELDIRAVKSHYEYTFDSYKRQHPPVTIDSVYLTDLYREEFPKETIIDLYHTRRWDSETAYFGIKTHLEAERFNSGKYNIIVNELYGKILCYSICGIIYSRVNEIIIEKQKKDTNQKNLYEHIPNMKYICDAIRLEYKFLQCIILDLVSGDYKTEYLKCLEDDCSRHTVPVRPGRHYKRWGRWMSWIPTAKFRIDGRRNPPIEKCYKTKGYCTVQ